MNIVKEMIDISNATFVGNNSDAKYILSSGIDNGTSIELISSINATNGNNLNSWKTSTYANGFDFETIVLFVMFIVCAIIYGSKYWKRFFSFIYFIFVSEMIEHIGYVLSWKFFCDFK